MPTGYSERGFADYTKELPDTHGNTGYLRESSAASIEEDDGITGPWLWFFLRGEFILEDGAEVTRVGQSTTRVAKGHNGFHMDIETARIIRDGIDEWIIREEQACDWIEPLPAPRDIMPGGTRWAGKTKDDTIIELERRLADAHRQINSLANALD